MKQLTIAGLKQAFATLGYTWSKTAPNLIGIRTALAVPNVFNDVFVAAWTQPAMPAGLNLLQQQQFLNRFGYVGANGKPLVEDGDAGKNTSYALEQLAATIGTERMRAWVFTSLPGAFYLQTPVAGGCAVAAPGQWKKVWVLGLHQRKDTFRALVERASKAIGFYRDNDRDALAETTGQVYVEHIGLNCHRSNAAGRTMKIDSWSAGCQVFQAKADHDELLGICQGFEARGGQGFDWTKEKGNEYDYTLLLEGQLA